MRAEQMASAPESCGPRHGEIEFSSTYDTFQSLDGLQNELPCHNEIGWFSRRHKVQSGRLAALTTYIANMKNVD